VTDRGATAAVHKASKRDWVEIVAAVLLSVAAVAIAWSGYQATRWNGEQAKAASRTNAIRIDAARASSLAEAQTEVDVATFIQWVDARAGGDDELASFYRARFRADFKPAFTASLATRPFTNANAPPTPFAMPAYKLESTAEAERLDAEAEKSATEVRSYIQRGSNYILAVVLFSVSLFFAGMSAKLDVPGLRKAMLAVGCVVFAGTAVWIATFPVSVVV
jgi:hypothetical protein